MSWDQYVQARLVNYTDKNGKGFANCLEKAALIGNDNGLAWAATAGFAFSTYKCKVDSPNGEIDADVDEFKSLKDAFAHNGDCTLPGGIRMGKEKFYMVNFNNDDKIMYLKKQGGGACVAMTAKAYVIGIFNTTLMMTNSTGAKENQNCGMCNTVVEGLATYLKSVQY